MTGRAPLSGLLGVVAPPPSEQVRLDDVDRHLIALLAADSRVSQRKLARELHLSPPTVGERIARLEKAGVIRGYTILLGWASLGYGTVYLTVTAIQGADQAGILLALRALPEVEEVAVITGSMDMLARIRVRNHEHLRELLLTRIWQIDGVQRTETFISLAETVEKDDYIDCLLTAGATAEETPPA